MGAFDLICSQRREEEAILAWAGDRHGSFLDLGCYDGISSSTTAALAEKGWPGLCIDASPDAAAACATRYRYNPNVEVLLAAFDHQGGNDPRVIHWTPSQMYTSLEPGRREDFPATPILIPPVDLLWLGERLADQPDPLFVNIDLEGRSVEALEWMVENVAFDCVCVEANNPDEQQRVAEILGGWAELEVNPWNSIFARVEVAA